MFRLSALNEQTNQSSSFEKDTPKGTKEAQEAYAFSLYNNALQLQRNERHKDAISVYKDLLETQLVTTAATTLVDENGEATERPLKDPGLILKYSTHKNMASMAADRGDINAAMEHYLQAVMLDPTDVTLWHRIGSHAITLGRLALARHAFTSGLSCNENYWPCLDASITVLYALSDYESCLYWIAKALERDYSYIKGLVFREKMFLECPHLRVDSQKLFKDCSLSIHDVEIDESEAMQFITEAVQLREQHRKLCAPQPHKPCNLSLHTLSWADLGECLLSTYDLIMDSSVYSFASPICFGDVKHLRQKSIEKDIVTENIKEDTKKILTDIDKDKSSDELLKDENSLAGQSTEDSTGFSEDSVGFSGVVSESKFIVSSYFSLSQQINTSQDGEDDQDVVRDVVDSLLQTVSSSLEENIVSDVVEDLVGMVVQNSLNDKDIVDEVLQQIIDTVESKFNESVLINDAFENILSEEETGINFDGALNDEEDEIKVKRNPKKKKSMSEGFFDENMKRRSNRVRVSSKKRKKEDVEPEEATPSVNYKQEIIDIFPEEFVELPNVFEDEVNITEATNDVPMKCKLDHTYVNETDDVLRFIERNEGDLIINIMQDYYNVLSTKIDLGWEKKTKDIVGKIFITTRPHFTQLYLEDIEDSTLAKKLLFGLLTCIECLVDGNISKKESEKHHLSEINEHIDLLISAATTYQHLFKISDIETELFEVKSKNRDWKTFTLRLLWLRIQHGINTVDYKEAVNLLDVCSDIIKTVRTNAFSSVPFISDPIDSYFIELPNLEKCPVISLSSVQKRLKNLEQAKLFESSNTFYEHEKFADVIRILKPTIGVRSSHNKKETSGRPKQVRQLTLSCQYLPDHSSLVQTSPHVINEIMTSLKDAENLKKKKKISEKNQKLQETIKQWKITLNITLQALDKALRSSDTILNETKLDDRTHICHALSSILDYLLASIERGKNVNNVITTSILLYKVLASVETNDEVIKSKTPPPSLLLLSTAHKWLGEKSMCCACDGNLLRFFTTEITRRFPSDVDCSFKPVCNQYMEQCFFCMFGYPNKPKSRVIEDHTAKPLPLTWLNSLALFRHFRPVFLPEFDSYKTSTVSQELCQLLHRILPFIPSHVSNRIPNSESRLSEFIENHCDDVTTLKAPPSDDDEVILLSDMYYLLADYYFKNNEMVKALKFYLQDLRINSRRFDAWAGLALARSSQIDGRLRLCETKKTQQKAMKDSNTERKGLAALACFKQALNLDSNNAKLWIECGSLAYWIHSMTSRKIKRSVLKLEEDEERRNEMLKLSEHSFQKALNCEGDELQDEEWFIYYMLGKISEKQCQPLKDYIKLYQASGQLLHHRNAKYPKKIQAKYGFSKELAIEALEIHFRIHSSILKYALNNTYVLKKEQAFIHDVLDEMKNSPFVTRNEVKNTQSLTSDPDKSSKLVVTSQSSDLTMGSLLPYNVLQALNIEEPKTDDDSQSSACSLAPPLGEQNDDSASREQLVQSVTLTHSVADQDSQSDNSTSEETPENNPTEKAEKSKLDIISVIDSCESAFRLCARRFPHHNKSIYRLAHIYATSSSRKHLNWSRDLLYGASSPWQQLRHMPAPGLLSDRNKTNLFNGVWRIPVDDIDRPGSFPAHLYRCLYLLLDVLRQLKDNSALLRIHNLLHRTPDHGKKYLREEDRILLARRALVFCRGILYRKIQSLPYRDSIRKTSSPEISTPDLILSVPSKTAEVNLTDCEKEVITMVDTTETSLNVLMDAYKVYQDTLKHNESTTGVDSSTEPDDKNPQQLLLDAYNKYTCLTRADASSVSPNDKSNLLEEALRFCNQQNTIRKPAAASSTAKAVTQSTTSTGNHQTNNSKPVATVAPQKRPNDKSSTILENTECKSGAKQENNENGLNPTESKSQLGDKPNKGQITMVADQGGRTYTKIAPPNTELRSLAPSVGGAFHPQLDPKRLRLDPGLRHLQDSSKKLIRSTSVPVKYAEGEENTPPPHRLLCRTGSCVSDSTKRKLKNTILAKTSAALVRKPSITDHEMHQLRVRLDPYDTDSSESEDEEDFPEEEVSSGRKRKFSDESPTPVPASEHPSLISTHQPSVITTAEST